VLLELVNLKKSDDKDTITWGETHNLVVESNLIAQTGWKDNAFCLMMSTVFDGREMVQRERKRPKETSTKGKTARVAFGDQPRKVLWIPKLFDSYNYNMLAVDQHNHMTAQNSGLRQVRRGGSQAAEHWLLRVVLVNTYLLALCADVEGSREVNFRSQADFRMQLISALLATGRTAERVPKRRISNISTCTNDLLIRSHEHIKMQGRKDCASQRTKSWRPATEEDCTSHNCSQ
jgi:hypothetical protein